MPPPSGKTHMGMPVPFWFNAQSANAFRSTTMRSNDVVLSSLVKAGTTWTHKILHSLLHVYDDDGNVIPGTNDKNSIGASGQVYPSALAVNRKEQTTLLEENDSAMNFSKQNFGDFTLDELCDQPEPRLFSTHLFGMDLLPQELLGSITTDDENKKKDTDDDGKGRLIIVLRNLKDVLCSLHYFLGEAKDGWLGNEHGPGSYHRFIADDCPNAFGSPFDWIAEMDKVVTFLQEKASAAANKNGENTNKQRVLVVYYEAMKADLPAQIDRINSFLGLKDLTPEKRSAVASACGFDAMKSGSGISKMVLRKGSIGDWRNHLTKDLWDKFDDIFHDKLGNVEIAAPLRHFQRWTVPGMPPTSRKEWTNDTDPRTWPVFERVSLEDGMVIPAKHISKNKEGQFKRAPSEYNGMIPSDKFEANVAGRYHLFVSGICPWASSTAVARHLLGLEDVISMDIADGQSGAGWTFLDGASVEPWKDRSGPFWLHEAYQVDDPLVTTRITVPVLWDTQTNTIVSNDSWSIIKMMSTAFAGMGKPSVDAAKILGVDESGHTTLIPDGKETLVETVHSSIYAALLNGVYRAGLGLMMNNEVETEAVIAARKGVYDKLSEVDRLLSRQRFLLGDKLTAPDIRLAMTLFRWDCSYREAFVLKGGHGGILLEDGDGYPNLKSYLRDLYTVMAPLVDFPAIRQYYRIRQGVNKAHLLSKGEEYKEEKKEHLCTLPDLNDIITSVKQPAGTRPTSGNESTASIDCSRCR